MEEKDKCLPEIIKDLGVPQEDYTEVEKRFQAVRLFGKSQNPFLNFIQFSKDYQ